MNNVKEKVNKLNEAPLYIRLSSNKKRKLISLKERINIDFWDFENNKIFPNYDRKEYLELFNQERIKNAKYYRSCLNCLLKYTKGKDIEFTQIDASFLTDYSNWMQKEKLHKNTIGNRLRGLKAIYNQAILYKYVSKDLYPFDTFKVSKYRMDTTKRVITKSDIRKIIQLDLSKISTNINYQYYDFARDIFLFSYFSCGINIVDIAYLKSENIVDNDRLCFYRRKTKKLFSFKMHSKALDILLKYRVSNTSDYIFPILDTQISEIDKYNRVNEVLKTIGKSGAGCPLAPGEVAPVRQNKTALLFQNKNDSCQNIIWERIFQ